MNPEPPSAAGSAVPDEAHAAAAPDMLEPGAPPAACATPDNAGSDDAPDTVPDQLRELPADAAPVIAAPAAVPELSPAVTGARLTELFPALFVGPDGNGTWKPIKLRIHADIQAAAAAAGTSGRVAISGFCTGGSWAWRASAKFRFPAQVNFYGSHIPALIEVVPQCPTILHYGEKDLLAPAPAIDNIRARHPAVELYVYPGAAHAFENVEQANYDAAAADLAWQRSIAFMDRHVGNTP